MSNFTHWTFNHRFNKVLETIVSDFDPYWHDWMFAALLAQISLSGINRPNTARMATVGYSCVIGQLEMCSKSGAPVNVNSDST